MSAYLFPTTVNSTTYTLTAGSSFYRTRQKPVLGIVLHVTAGLQDLDLVGTDGSAEGTAKWAIGRPVSWHVGVDSDSIRPCLPASYTGWHAKGYNSSTIGIEISNLDARWDNKPAEWVTRTLRNAARACAGYVKQYNLPLALANKSGVDSAVANNRKFGFTYHSYLSDIRVDPGKTFPWTRFIAMVKEELSGAPAPAPTTASQFYCQRGDTGAAVSRVQKIVGVTADGSFGPATETAVKAWQTKMKILVDGKWGPVSEATYQKSIAVPVTTGTFCKEGDTGPVVERTQKIVGTPVTGRFDYTTLKAVKAWQVAYAVPVVSGAWDAGTEHRYQSVLKTGVSRFPLPYGHWYGRNDGTTGSHSGLNATDSTNIKRIQQQIGRLTVDGKFGPAMEQRVKDLQNRAGIPVTGKVDSRTWVVFVIK